MWSTLSWMTSLSQDFFSGTHFRLSRPGSPTQLYFSISSCYGTKHMTQPWCRPIDGCAYELYYQVSPRAIKLYIIVLPYISSVSNFICVLTIIILQGKLKLWPQHEQGKWRIMMYIISVEHSVFLTCVKSKYVFTLISHKSKYIFTLNFHRPLQGTCILSQKKALNLLNQITLKELFHFED